MTEVKIVKDGFAAQTDNLKGAAPASTNCHKKPGVRPASSAPNMGIKSN
jgi:hypothetical protein